MNYLLRENWSLGSAIGELLSSFFLVFGYLLIKLYFKTKDKDQPIIRTILTGIVGLIAIYMGTGVGNLISSNGTIMGNKGLGIMVPFMSLLVSFHFHAYNALWYLITFQIIGSVIAIGAYFIVAYLYRDKGKINNLTVVFERKEKKLGSNTIFTFLSQVVLLIGAIGIISLEDPGNSGNYGFSVFNKNLLFILLITIVSILFLPIGEVLIMPVVTIANLVFTRTKNIKDITTDSIEISIAMLMATIVGIIDVTVRYGSV